MKVLKLQKYQTKDYDTVSDSEQYILRVRDLPNDERPREKLLAYGPKALTSAELIAILLAVGTRKEEVMSMASRILKEYGEQTLYKEADPAKLAKTLDIPFGKACQIVASFELGRRYYHKKVGKPVVVRTAKQAYEYVKSIGISRKEQLRGLYLNSRYQVIHEEIISTGSLTANIIHPREVFSPALEHSAAAVIIAHNHPSGSLRPSAADIQITKQLISARTLLGIELLDHLIITEQNYKSIIKEV